MGITAALQRSIGGLLRPILNLEEPTDDQIQKTPWAALSRRDLLFGGALPAMAGFTALAEPEAEPALEKGTDPLLRRLVERCCYGASKQDMALAKQLGYDDYLEYQLDYTNIDDSDLNARLADFVSLDYTAKQMADAANDGNYDIFYELENATIQRAAYSKRQLYQRMVEFWTDHFNIYIEKDYQYYLKPVDDREVIRRHALGNFPQLLSASAHSPSMLVYLDNDPSSKDAPNQNYARELLELHTLGVGNYTQTDIENVARCFTGWSVAYDFEQANWGTFRFYNWAHDKNKKTVLGHELPKRNGIRDGEAVLDMLTKDPTISQITARFIGKKMATWLWGYNPPQALIDDMAAAYASTNGDIKAMVRVALSADWLSQASPKLKRPFHYVMSSLRMLPSHVNEYWGVRYALSLMGHEPFQWITPDGYHDTVDYWSGLILPRWRYGAVVFGQDWDPKFNLSSFEGTMDTPTFMNKLSKTFFGGKMNPTDRDLLEAYVDPEIDSEWRRKETLGLAISCSSFQWY